MIIRWYTLKISIQFPCEQYSHDSSKKKTKINYFFQNGSVKLLSGIITCDKNGFYDSVNFRKFNVSGSW